MGRSCKNPPYEYMTSKKYDSIGETMPLKKALNMWWNCVRLVFDNETYYCYKCCDGEYELNGLDEAYLNVPVELEDDYDEDADGYPIIYAHLAK